MKAAVVVERIGPYHAARLRAAAEVFGRHNLVAVEIAADSSEYAWATEVGEGFERRTLFADRPYQRLRVAEIATKVYRTLDDLSPDVVAINGWSFPEARAAAAWCRSRDRVAVLMAESQRRDAPRAWWREAIKRARLRAYDAALVGGKSHSAYVARLGMDQGRIVPGYDVVDNEHFSRGALAARANGEVLRKGLELPSKYLLAVSRFIPKKRLDLLLRAYARWRQTGPGRPDLLILGDGPERPTLEKLVGDLALQDHVRLPGFRQYTELPAYYGLAEAFVLPSSVEQWGLVVNEAMASGLPVVGSDAAGSVSELIEEGVEGFLFKSGSERALVAKLDALAAADRAAMGLASARKINNWGPRRFAEGLERAFVLGDEHRKRRRHPRRVPAALAIPAPPSSWGHPSRQKIAVIVERIGPYHAARVNALSAQVGEDAVVVIEVASKSSEYDWDPVITSGFKRLTLETERSYQELTPRAIRRLVSRALDAENPTSVAINGWSFPEAVGAARWCARRLRPAILMSASQERDAKRLFLRETVKRKRVSLFGAALVGGARQLGYLKRLGFPTEKVFSGYDVVDNDYFQRGAERARQEREATVVRLGVPTNYFLCVARLIPKKNMLGLLEAFARYCSAPRHGSWDLVVAGDGPMKQSVETGIRHLGLIGRVRLIGSRQYVELPALYGVARALVLASTQEQWGLVVNEAMAAGLPVLVSSSCGCSQDLVADGDNGFTFNPLEFSALADRMLQLERGDNPTMGRRSAEIISEWGPRRFADGMIHCIEMATNNAEQSPAGALTRLAWWL